MTRTVGSMPTTAHRRRRATRLAALAVTGTLAATTWCVGNASPASAATVARYHVAGTGGTGISARTSPTAAPGATFGAAEGATLDVQCQIEGEGIGPRGNRLYFQVNQGGRVFYAPDYYTDSPHLAAQPPIAGIPMCTPPPPPRPTAIVAHYHVSGTGGTGISARTSPTAAPGATFGAAEGATLNVRCQIEGEGIGPRGNRLYFQVDQGGRVFYAPDYYTDSPHLAAQPPIAGIPMCSGPTPPPTTSTKAQGAANWARAHLGQVYATGADAAAYSAADWGSPYAEWSGDCIKFAQRAWAAVGVSVARGNAIDVFRTYQARGQVHGGTPPVGALVFWNTTAYGHVAISVGGSQVIGTRGMDTSRKPIQQYAISAIPGYLGWVLPA